MDSIYLLPGEERCVNFRDSDGIPKVHYTYCSLHGRLFNCTCRTKDEAPRQRYFRMVGTRIFILIGFAIWSFIPASSATCLSSVKAFAVIAMMGIFAF